MDDVQNAGDTAEKSFEEKVQDVLESVRTAFIVFSVLCFGGVFASLARGRVHGGQRAGVRRG